MAKQLTISNAIERLSTIYKNEGKALKELHAREETQNQWKGNCPSQRVWLAFLIPSDSSVLVENESALCKTFGKDIFMMKTEALKIAANDKLIKKLKTKERHSKKAHLTIALALLELTRWLQLDQIDAKRAQDASDAWISLADSLGYWRIRYELEDEVFRVKDPKNYALMHSLMEKHLKIHEELFMDIISIVRYSLKEKGVSHADIVCRRKNAYGIFLKMQIKGRNINHISDLFGFRIVTHSKQDCYSVLNALHTLWPQFPDKLKDYIARPKQNGYQSIHTTVSCLNRETIEFQIRSKEMDEVAKYGKASHAEYKSQTRKAT